MTNLEKKNKAFHIALNELLLEHEAFIYPDTGGLSIGVSACKSKGNRRISSLHQAPYGVGYIGGEDNTFVPVYKLRYTKKHKKAVHHNE